MVSCWLYTLTGSTLQVFPLPPDTPKHKWLELERILEILSSMPFASPIIHVYALEPTISRLLRDPASSITPRSLLHNCNTASQFVFPICILFAQMFPTLKTNKHVLYIALQLLVYVSPLAVQFLRGVSCTLLRSSPSQPKAV